MKYFLHCREAISYYHEADERGPENLTFDFIWSKSCKCTYNFSITFLYLEPCVKFLIRNLQSSRTVNLNNLFVKVK
jgi:hypothetical protein